MEIPKKYLHDKPILALLSANLFLTGLVVLSILLRISGSGTDGFVAQFRENLGLNAFQAGDVFSILSFIAFALVVMVLNSILSVRTYEIKRQLSLVVLGFATLLLVLTLIVSNALLVLQ